MKKRQLYTLKAFSNTRSFSFYVVASNTEKALAAGKKEYPYMSIYLLEELGEVIVDR